MKEMPSRGVVEVNAGRFEALFRKRRKRMLRGVARTSAPTERFFASFEHELVYRTHFPTHAAARSAVFAWIEVWYNRKRRHSTLDYLSTKAFERQYQQERQEQRPMAS